jgi:hypothetical protein
MTTSQSILPFRAIFVGPEVPTGALGEDPSGLWVRAIEGIAQRKQKTERTRRQSPNFGGCEKPLNMVWWCRGGEISHVRH